MAYGVLLLAALLLLASHSVSGSINSYCESWKFSIEANNAGDWKSIIPQQCKQYVANYINGARYLSDSVEVTRFASAFAKTVEISSDGKDAWVFDIDETLLSNVPYYEINGFGSKYFNETKFDLYEELGKLPALPASLKFYEEVKELGFAIMIISGRKEYMRNITGYNLIKAGYNNWTKLFFKGTADKGKKAIVYKSEKRVELVKKGYRLLGSMGDQWSDLFGNATAERSFKLPNPMYYVA